MFLCGLQIDNPDHYKLCHTDMRASDTSAKKLTNYQWTP